MKLLKALDENDWCYLSIYASRMDRTATIFAIAAFINVDAYLETKKFDVKASNIF